MVHVRNMTGRGAMGKVSTPASALDIASHKGFYQHTDDPRLGLSLRIKLLLCVSRVSAEDKMSRWNLQFLTERHIT